MIFTFICNTKDFHVPDEKCCFTHPRQSRRPFAASVFVCTQTGEKGRDQSGKTDDSQETQTWHGNQRTHHQAPETPGCEPGRTPPSTSTQARTSRQKAGGGVNGYCNMCGKCCEAITLWTSPEGLTKYKTHDESSDRGWAAKHFHPITREEAFKRNPFHRMVEDSGHPSFVEGKLHYYDCDAFDRQTRRCTQHEKRPRTCSAYPYGDQRDSQWIPYSPTCDYIHDMPPASKQLMVELALELEAVSD